MAVNPLSQLAKPQQPAPDQAGKFLSAATLQRIADKAAGTRSTASDRSRRVSAAHALGLDLNSPDFLSKLDTSRRSKLAETGSNILANTVLAGVRPHITGKPINLQTIHDPEAGGLYTGYALPDESAANAGKVTTGTDIKEESFRRDEFGRLVPTTTTQKDSRTDNLQAPFIPSGQRTTPPGTVDPLRQLAPAQAAASTGPTITREELAKGIRDGSIIESENPARPGFWQKQPSGNFKRIFVG